MWSLLLATVLTSAADSVNPITLTQQFVLQGMVKKPWHIWCFIVPIALTNLVTGMLAYWGLIGFVGGFLADMLLRYAKAVFILELVLGIFLILYALYVFAKSFKKTEAASAEKEQEAAARKFRSVTPTALMLFGVVATLAELTSALPYFAFLAIMLSYHLAPWQAVLILILYNLIYILPATALYIVYRKAQKSFDKIYALFQKIVQKCSRILGPLLIAAVGGALLAHAAEFFG